jgi:hypothetical protein
MDDEAGRRRLPACQCGQRLVDTFAAQIQVNEAAGHCGHGRLGLALHALRVDADE